MYIMFDLFSFSCFSSSIFRKCATKGSYKRKGFAMEERRRGKMAAGYWICSVSDMLFLSEMVKLYCGLK